MTALRPPADLSIRTPRLFIVKTGTILHRFYNAAYEPIFFDLSQCGRLNAPDGGFGVLYLASTVNGAFAETFLRQPGRRLLPNDLIAAKAYVRVRATRKLTFVKFFGTGLAPIGATAEVTHGSLPYDAPQAWSAALHDHGVAADGIAYFARHDDTEICFALFDRAREGFEEIERDHDLDTNWFWTVGERYGVGRAPA